LQLELLWSLKLTRHVRWNRAWKALADAWDRFIQLPDKHAGNAAAWAAVRAAQAEFDVAANEIDPKFPP
jgi:hypothetical protein